MSLHVFSKEYNTTSSASVSGIEIKESSTGVERATTLRQTDAAFGEVIGNTVLTARGKPVKRHIGTSMFEHLRSCLTSCRT